MNAQADWQELNAQYLAVALEWLRLKLAKAAPPVEPAPKRVSEKPRGWLTRLFCKSSDPQTSVAVQVAPLVPPSDEDIASAEQRMLQLEENTPPPMLISLGKRLGLSRFEQQVLLLCVAMELDTRMPYLCACAQDDARKSYPTFALAFSLFDDPAWDSLAPHHPLRYWQLIEINQPGATPLTSSALHADERIVGYIKGLNNLDDRLRTLLVPLDGPGVAHNDLSPSQHTAAKTLADSLVWHAKAQSAEVIQLVGPDPISKHQVVWEALHRTSAARYRRMRPFRLADEQIPTQPGEFESFLRLWGRERRLLSVALYLELSDDGSSAHTERSSAIRRLLSRARGLVFVDTREIRPDLAASTLTFDIQKPAPKEQQDYWSAALGERNSTLAAGLAAQFNLNLPTIAELVAQSTAGEGDLSTRVWEACLTRTRPGLEKLAQRIDAKATWKQIVLPDEPEHLLHAITAQVGKRSQVYDDWGFRRRMNRGLGISALFAGESGTGKTMAAEVIANDLGLDLYRIDLSAVVSKYIGETEKNLRRVFDAAENGGAILFFDEADALFGKRSEVRDSHDRYANIEINYLLQRMEAFRGLAILATNRKSALDQAFLRRLRFIVDFPFPAAAERAAIWERVFPDEVPRDSLDYDRLARFSLSGGSIHNIALNAAFLAAATPGGTVTIAHVQEAAKAEFRKLDKPVNERDFHVLEAIGDKV